MADKPTVWTVPPQVVAQIAVRLITSAIVSVRAIFGGIDLGLLVRHGDEARALGGAERFRRFLE